jgi:hypothetical protein
VTEAKPDEKTRGERQEEGTSEKPGASGEQAVATARRMLKDHPEDRGALMRAFADLERDHIPPAVHEALVKAAGGDDQMGWLISGVMETPLMVELRGFCPEVDEAFRALADSPDMHGPHLWNSCPKFETQTWLTKTQVRQINIYLTASLVSILSLREAAGDLKPIEVELARAIASIPVTPFIELRIESGEGDPVVLQKAVAQLWPEIDSCVRAADRDIAAEMEIRFAINAGGTVESAEAAEGWRGPEGVASCITERFRTMKVGAPWTSPTKAVQVLRLLAFEAERAPGESERGEESSPEP